MRDVLKANQMLAGLSRVTRLLIGARDSELGRGMQRIQLERVLESVDGLGKLLVLRVRSAEEIPGVGIVRIECR